MCKQRKTRKQNHNIYVIYYLLGERRIVQKKGFVGIYVFKTMYRKQGTVTIQYKMFVFL